MPSFFIKSNVMTLIFPQADGFLNRCKKIETEGIFKQVN